MSDQTVLTFDMDAVTPRMMVDFQEATGRNLMELAGTELDPSEDPKVLAGVIWIAMRMSGNPDATFDEALDTPFTTLNLGGGQPEDPSPASNDAS